MYRIPDELALSCVTGEVTTQIRVGKYDLRFSFGRVHFSIWSPILLFDGEHDVPPGIRADRGGAEKAATRRRVMIRPAAALAANPPADRGREPAGGGR